MEITVVKRATNKYTVIVDAANQFENWTLPDSLGQVTDLKIETTGNVKLVKTEIEKLCLNMPSSLNTLDLSGANIENLNSTSTDGPEANPLKTLNSASSW